MNESLKAALENHKNVTYYAQKRSDAVRDRGLHLQDALDAGTPAPDIGRALGVSTRRVYAMIVQAKQKTP